MEKDNQVNLPDIIKSRKILPFEVKSNIINNIFYNCLMFIFMLIITLVVNISFDEFAMKDFESYIDIIQITCGIISVVILETAYRKDSGAIAWWGLEFLGFSIAVLFVPYMYMSKERIFFMQNVIIAFGVYYLIKSLATLIHIRHSYLKDNISDIKELVKDEEPKSYLDEESTKTLKMQKLEDEKRKKAKAEKKKGKKVGGKNND